jgi:hypothetical protein
MAVTFRIIALGDGMTASAGPAMPALAAALYAAWPTVAFEVINHGVPGSRAGHGLWRLTHDCPVGDRVLPAVVSLQPDIVLIESFAHTNAADGIIGDDGVKHLRDMHWRMLSTLRETTQADVVAVVTVAPDCDHFLETTPGYIQTPVAVRRWMAKDRRHYLEEAVRTAQAWELPLADAYHASLDPAIGGAPLARFIDPATWQVPSEEGHRLVARLVVETLQRHALIDTRLAGNR